MNTIKKNYIIDEDFTDKPNKYYLVFKTPKNETKRIDNLEKIQLKRNTPDSVELKIKHEGIWSIYHYINEHIGLLDSLDLGFN